MATTVKILTPIHSVLHPKKLDIHVSVGLKNRYKKLGEASFECETGNQQL